MNDSNNFPDIDLDEKDQKEIKKEVNKYLLEKAKYKDIPEYGNLMTIEEWLEDVNAGYLIDYDGYGELSYKDKTSSITISPSDIKDKSKKELLKNFTHIVWYNR